MKKKQHKTRGIRLSDEVWKALKDAKPRGKSWNLFIKELLNK